MNILFIGNSYTFYNDMPAIFQSLAAENGNSVTVHSVTAGGRRLERYLNPEDPITARLDDLLKTQTFDVCFIQEQSLLPVSDYDRFLTGLECVVGKVRNRAERLILYVTWGRKTGSSQLEQLQLTSEAMALKLAQAYQNGAAIHGAEQSPVGMNFLKITQNHPEIDLYDKDLSHPSYTGSCLIALTHYYALFGQFPTNTATLSLSQDTISAFKSLF